MSNELLRKSFITYELYIARAISRIGDVRFAQNG